MRGQNFTIAAVAAFLATPAASQAMTLNSPAPGQHVDSRATLSWTRGANAFYGGVYINPPDGAPGEFDSPCCTGQDSSFTPPYPLWAGEWRWSGQEEIPGAEEGTSVTITTPAQTFIVDPSIRLTKLQATWSAGQQGISIDLSKPAGATMTLRRGFADSNLPSAWETTTVTNAGGARVYRVRGFGPTTGAHALDPLSRKAVYLLPTLARGTYKVKTQIRVGGETGKVAVERSTTLRVTRKAKGYGKKDNRAACGVDNPSGTCVSANGS